MSNSMFGNLAARILSNASGAPEGGFDAPLWQAVEAAGLDRILLPESLDGAGDALDEAVAVMVAFGGAGASIPLLETIVANWCLAHAGLDVPPGAKALLIEPEPDGLRMADGRLTWRGEAHATWMPVTGMTVAVAPHGGGRMVVASLPDDRSGHVGETLAGEPQSRLLDNGAGLSLGPQGQLARDPRLPLAIAAVLQAAAIAGAIDRTCELTIVYANTREQFGRPISRFQAVQHMAARLASENAAVAAAVAFAGEQPFGTDLLWRAAVAKSRASEAAGHVAADAHQIHGAIGFTREYELQRHSRRLWAWRERFGNEHYWNGRIGHSVLRLDEESLWAELVNGLEP